MAELFILEIGSVSLERRNPYTPFEFRLELNQKFVGPVIKSHFPVKKTSSPVRCQFLKSY